MKHVLNLVHDLFVYAEVTKDGLFSVGEMECMVSHFSYILLMIILILFGGLDSHMTTFVN